MSDELILRCEITGNPFGTDTFMVGGGCTCQACRAATEIEQLKARNAEQRQKCMDAERKLIELGLESAEYLQQISDLKAVIVEIYNSNKHVWSQSPEGRDYLEKLESLK